MEGYSAGVSIMDGIASSYSFRYGQAAQGYGEEGSRAKKATQEPEATGEQSSASTAKTNRTSSETLTSEELETIRELKARDKTVRQHEAAHLAAAGGLAMSAASYSMQTGPDGKRYAIGGEVQIDIAPGQTPEETLRKARIIQAAALAPADPSGQDRNIASQAKAMEIQAEAEIAQRSIQQQRVENRYRNDSLPQSTIAIEA